MIVWISVALAVALADVCWTMYFIETSNRNAHRAAAWSTGIILCGAYSIIQYTASAWLLTAAAVGAYIGTWLTVKFAKPKE